jgi:outer membrane lipoprotein-sorting protein
VALSWILTLAAAATAQPGDAEAVKLFRQMEATLRAVKAVKVAFTTERRHQGEAVTAAEGMLLLGNDNRVRFELRGRWAQGGSALFVSDGKAFAGSGARAPEKREAPALLRHDLLMRFAVRSASNYPPWTAGVKGAMIETAKGLRVRGFKLQPDEKVGGRLARVVRYEYATAAPITLWIDAQTHLPLKRRLGTADDGLTETYTEVTLEPPLDAAAFDLKPVRAARAAAEKLFRAMEQQVREADTLRVVVEQGDVYQPELYRSRGREVYKYKGRLLLGGGQKARLELTRQSAGKENRDLVIADGKQLIGVGEHVDTKGKPVPQARTLTALCGQYTARRGLLPLFGAEGVQGEKYDIEKHLPADNFHLGRREKVGGREAQVIEYQVKLPGYRDELTLWLDVETGLPLKRVTERKFGARSRTTELYREFTVNPRLDPRLFVLPKKERGPAP